MKGLILVVVLGVCGPAMAQETIREPEPTPSVYPLRPTGYNQPSRADLDAVTIEALSRKPPAPDPQAHLRSVREALQAALRDD